MMASARRGVAVSAAASDSVRFLSFSSTRDGGSFYIQLLLSTSSTSLRG